MWDFFKKYILSASDLTSGKLVKSDDTKSVASSGISIDSSDNVTDMNSLAVNHDTNVGDAIIVQTGTIDKTSNSEDYGLNMNLQSTTTGHSVGIGLRVSTSIAGWEPMASIRCKRTGTSVGSLALGTAATSNGNCEDRLVIDKDGDIAIGADATTMGALYDRNFEVAGTNNASIALKGDVTGGDGNVGEWSFLNDSSAETYNRVCAIRGRRTTNDNSGSMHFATTKDSSLSTRMEIDEDGAVKMNSYGAGTATFDASGNITSVSDERLKEDIQPFTRGLSDLSKINPKTYMWTKGSGLDRSKTYTGFIAQNVQKAIPEAVSGKDGTLSLDDRPIIAALVNAVRELTKRIEELEK